MRAMWLHEQLEAQHEDIIDMVAGLFRLPTLNTIPENHEIANMVREVVFDVLETNEPRYGKGWVTDGLRKHAEHAIAHLKDYLGGDESDNHLENALTRVTFLLVLAMMDHADSHMSEELHTPEDNGDLA